MMSNDDDGDDDSEDEEDQRGVARGSAVPLPPSGSHLPLLQVEVGAQVTLG